MILIKIDLSKPKRIYFIIKNLFIWLCRLKQKLKEIEKRKEIIIQNKAIVSFNINN
jgi:hypothetical protein